MKKNEIIDKLTAGELTPDEAKKLLALADQPDKRGLSCRVSQKGAVSIYGLQSRFPVTLYAEQWERLLDFGDVIREFIKDNDAALNRKDRPAGAEEEAAS